MFLQMKNNEEKSMLEKNSVLSSFESKVELKFTQEEENRKILEDKLSTLIEDKYNEMKLLVSQEGKKRYDEFERVKSIMERDMPKVKAFPKYEIEERTNCDEQNKQSL